MIVPCGIEILSHILPKHKPVRNLTVGCIIVGPVDVIGLDFDICSIWLPVLVSGCIARMVVVLGTLTLVILKEIHRLGGFGMVTAINRISPGDAGPFGKEFT